MIYLDHAAATPISPAVRQAMEPFLEQHFYNPSATYLAAQQVRAQLEQARIQIAHCLGAKPGTITFTAGGTEANNLAIHGVMRQYPEANLVVSGIEHESVLRPAAAYDCRIAPVTPKGLVDIHALQQLIDDETVLVSVMYANNEIGTVEPLKRIAALLTQIRDTRRKKGINVPLYLHTDACQAGNYLDLHVARLGVDMLTLNAGKLYGPKQCGALYTASQIDLQPLIDGGGQERGLRSGTENVANIVGLATALVEAQTMRPAESVRLQQLQQRFIELLQQQVPSAQIHGSLEHRLPNNLSVSFPGQDNERLMMQLDEAGVQVATGSACTASSEEPSHVLAALGLDVPIIRSSLRFSLGRSTTETDVQQTVDLLAKFCKA